MTYLRTDSPTGQRGPSDHATRDQIVAAAYEHFSHYGYGKTTVSDLAKAIGFSKAYIYKFFDSKQAIGQAICAHCLLSIASAVEKSVSEGRTATDKLRRLIDTTIAESVALFAEDRKIYEIAVHSAVEKWPSSQEYIARFIEMLAGIITQGRASGEFEKKTPLDETCRSIVGAVEPYASPMMLQFKLNDLPRGGQEMVSLVLRSLAP